MENPEEGKRPQTKMVWNYYSPLGLGVSSSLKVPAECFPKLPAKCAALKRGNPQYPVVNTTRLVNHMGLQGRMPDQAKA